MTALEVHDVRYHRNGVAGEGFYLCELTLHEDDGPAYRLAASVFVDEDEAGNLSTMRASGGGMLVAVVDIDNPGQPFRGDWIGDDLLPSIRVAIDSRAAYR